MPRETDLYFLEEQTSYIKKTPTWQTDTRSVSPPSNRVHVNVLLSSITSPCK
jgi:hypothetical protein